MHLVPPDLVVRALGPSSTELCGGRSVFQATHLLVAVLVALNF